MTEELIKALDKLVKAGGEGSRGGRIVGHTVQGNAIYERDNIHSYHPTQLKPHHVHVDYTDQNGIPKTSKIENVMATGHSHAAQRVSDQFKEVQKKYPNARVTKIHVEPAVKKADVSYNHEDANLFEIIEQLVAGHEANWESQEGTPREEAEDAKMMNLVRVLSGINKGLYF